MFPTVEAFWLSGQWPNTPVVSTGSAGSDLDASASRALAAAPRSGSARSDLDASAPRTLFVAARTGVAYSDFDATAARTLLAAARSGVALSSLSATASRALTITDTALARSDLDAAATRALILAARTSSAYTDLDASASGTTATNPPPAIVDTGGNAGGWVTQELIDAQAWPDWVKQLAHPRSGTGAARLSLGVSAERQIIETEDDAVILLLLGNP